VGQTVRIFHIPELHGHIPELHGRGEDGPQRARYLFVEQAPEGR